MFFKFFYSRLIEKQQVVGRNIIIYGVSEIYNRKGQL